MEEGWGRSAVAAAAARRRRGMSLRQGASPPRAMAPPRVPGSPRDDLERAALDERLHRRALRVVERDLAGLQRTQVQNLSARQRDAQRLLRLVPNRRRHAGLLVVTICTLRE